MAYINKKEQTKRRVKEDLLNQLKSRGLTGEYYLNLVEDYMFLYGQKEQLQQDINERGVVVKTLNSKGLEIEKKNESCDLILKTNQQMMKVLDFLSEIPSQNTEDDDMDEL